MAVVQSVAFRRAEPAKKEDAAILKKSCEKAVLGPK